MLLYKNERVVEIILDDINTMKEGKGYSSAGMPKLDGIFSHLPLTSPLFKEWKYNPDMRALKEFEKDLAIDILKYEVGMDNSE